MTTIATPPKLQFFDSNGNPLAGGKLYTYTAGTTTPLATYTDYGGGTANPNPIILDSRGEANVWLGSARYKMKLTTSVNVDVWTVDNVNGADGATLAALAASGGSALVGYLPAGTGAVATTVQTKLRESVSVKDFGAVEDGTTNDTAAIQAALTASSTTVGGAQGNSLLILQGTSILSSTLNIPNRVGIFGVNKRGSVFKASASHSGPYMFTVVNGTSSMFDNPLQKLTVNCNDVAGLGGIISDAWQEGGGLRDVLILNFRGSGVLFQNGYGGASLCEIDQCEIFGSAVGAGVSGIQLNQISSIGSFRLKVSNTSIVGTPSFPLPKGIDVVKDSLTCINVHFEDCTSGIYLDGPGHHVLIGVTGGPSVTNVVEIASTFSGTLSMIGCHRASATNLLKDNRSGGYGTITSADRNVVIKNQPDVSIGAVNSLGIFDGTAVGVTNCFGVTSITKNGTGDYTINESNSRSSANAVVIASCNVASGTVVVQLVNTSSYRLTVYNASNVLSDSNEIKFACLRPNL
jgi:hypothetical protein